MDSVLTFLHIVQLLQKAIHSSSIVQLTKYVKQDSSCAIFVLEGVLGSFILEVPCNSFFSAEQLKLNFLKSQSGRVLVVDSKEVQEGFSTATKFKLFPFDPGGATSSLSTFIMGYIFEILIHYSMINGYLYCYDCSILANCYHMLPNFSFVMAKESGVVILTSYTLNNTWKQLQ